MPAPRAPSARAQLAQAYDALLADFVVGDYGRADLLEGERRNIVRERLHVAARRRGLTLRFRPGPGPLIFCVEEVSAASAALAVAPSISDRAPARPIAPRRQRQDRKPTGRYDKLLPRWMREGQPAGRRDGSKRRQGR
jgi:hypothetical protein